MLSAIKSLNRHQFFSLSSGVLASNALSLLVMPLLTRLYTADSFGRFALFWALTTILGTFATLRLELALPMVEDDRERIDLARLAFFCAVIGATGFAAIWSAIRPHDLAFGAAIAAASALMSGVSIEVQLAIHQGRLKILSMRYVTEKLVVLGASLGFSQWQGAGLLTAQILGLGASVIIIGIATKSPLFGSWRSPAGGRRRLLAKYRDFPTKSGAASLLQMLTAQLPSLMFSAWYPVSRLGQYNLAQRITEAPNTAVASSLATVVYRRLLAAPPSDRPRIFARTLRWTTIVLLPPLVALGLVTRPFVTYGFGPSWEPAHVFLLALLPLVFFRLLYMVGQFSFLVLRQMENDLIVSATTCAGVAMGIGIGYFGFDSMTVSVALASGLASLSYLHGVYLIARHLRIGATASTKGQNTP